MREILFRGKRVGSGEWVYGDLLTDGIDYITAIRVHNENKFGWSAVIEVIPETIGQYTGLTDKNGKKIFEGDILECKRIDDGITVRFLICIGKYVDYNSDDKNIGVYVLLNEGATIGVNDICEHQDMFEVIGNKWHNHELLQGEEK